MATNDLWAQELDDPNKPKPQADPLAALSQVGAPQAPGQYGGINPGGTQYSGGTTGGARGGINPNGMYAGGSANFDETTGTYRNGYVPPRDRNALYSGGTPQDWYAGEANLGGTQTPGIMPPLQSGGQYGGINPSANPSQPAPSKPDFSMLGGSALSPITQMLGQMGTPQAPGQYGGINPSANPQGPAPAPKPDGLSSTQPVPTGPIPNAPTNPGPQQPTPSTGPTDQAGVQQFQSWAQQTFGRQATPEELQQIAQQIGYGGGTLTPEMLKNAQNAAMTLAKSKGWTGSAPAPAPAGPAVPGAPGGTDPTTDPMRDQVRQTLERLMSEGTGQVDPNRPELVQQRNAFRRGQGRALEQAKRAAAERGAAGGTLNTGGFDADLGTMDLAAAAAEGDFEAGLVTRELEGQRDRMMAAVQLAQQSGQTDQARALQERLAQLNAQIQSRGQDIQGRLGQGDLDLRRLLGMGQLNLGYLNSNRSNDQFYSGLGAQLGMNNARLNQDALMALLNS